MKHSILKKTLVFFLSLSLFLTFLLLNTNAVFYPDTEVSATTSGYIKPSIAATQHTKTCTVCGHSATEGHLFVFTNNIYRCTLCGYTTNNPGGQIDAFNDGGE